MVSFESKQNNSELKKNYFVEIRIHLALVFSAKYTNTFLRHCNNEKNKEDTDDFLNGLSLLLRNGATIILSEIYTQM